jgi:hypothetical protein
MAVAALGAAYLIGLATGQNDADAAAKNTAFEVKREYFVSSISFCERLPAGHVPPKLSRPNVGGLSGGWLNHDIDKCMGELGWETIK